ncbi:hypothetical protein KUCAC02_028276, partial [Chaenocephalus aceratus]
LEAQTDAPRGGEEGLCLPRLEEVDICCWQEPLLRILRGCLHLSVYVRRRRRSLTPWQPPTPPFLSLLTYTHTLSNLLHPVSEPSPVSNLLLISCQLGGDDEVIIVGGGSGFNNSLSPHHPHSWGLAIYLPLFYRPMPNTQQLLARH